MKRDAMLAGCKVKYTRCIFAYNAMVNSIKDEMQLGLNGLLLH